MNESDDFLTGGGGVDIPTKAAENIKRTAEPAEQISDTARRNRRRRAAGTEFSQLELSTPGLLGIPSPQAPRGL